jgi:hypothetical protein
MSWMLFPVGTGIFVGGRMRARKVSCSLYGYVYEAISGGVFHSCKHGPPPHNIKVCVIEKGNEAVWEQVLQCAGPRPQAGSVAEEIQRVNRTKRFQDRGLSGMTIHKLIAAGLDMPERLLFMSPAEIGRLNGIEPVMRREIDAYRSSSGLGRSRCFLWCGVLRLGDLPQQTSIGCNRPEELPFPRGYAAADIATRGGASADRAPIFDSAQISVWQLFAAWRT